MKLKYIPFEIYGRLYDFFGVKKFAKNFLPDDFQVRVLCYHDIQDMRKFEKHIEFLKREYNVITAEQLKDFFLGRGFLSGKNIFITFDDGDETQYKAAEILDKHKVQACFFVTIKNIEMGIIGSRTAHLPAMTWEQVRDLSTRGHVIGSHTLTHPVLAKLQPIEIARELKESKNLLEEKISKKVNFFAFPYGTEKEISHEARLIAGTSYDLVFTFIPGRNDFADANRMFIKRIGIRPDFSSYHLRALMSGLKDVAS